MALSPQEIERALEIVGDAMELQDAELEAYLNKVCGEDSLLREEVLNFLRYDSPHSIFQHDHGGPLPKLTIHQAADSRYEIHDEIARGGMGVIHRARDTALGRDVAVKLLHESRQDDEHYIGRFIREAEISAQLQHPGIPPIYEIGRLPDGRTFISMKLINGHTLESLLSAREGPESDLPHMFGIVEQVCQTIAFAHSRQVIHRDLKPSNIMVGEFGEVQVMDWGLAKFLGATSESDEPSELADDPSSNSQDFGTRIGTMMGTPGYMPLEQAMGRAQKATDVFALGAILSDILTGCLREKTKSPVVVTVDVAEAELKEAWCRLDAVDGHIELVDLAKHCLQLLPVDRPRDAGEVARRVSLYSERLETQLHEAELAAIEAQTLAREERKRRHIMVVATLLMAITLCVAGWSLWRYAVQIERNAAENYRGLTVAAYHDFESGRFVQACELLDQAPEQFRNWEWHYLNDQTDQSTMTIETEADRIPLTGFAQGGELIVSVYSDNTAHHWNRSSGAHVGSASPGVGSPLDMDPTGRLVLSLRAGNEKLVLWKADNGEVLGEFPAAPYIQDPKLSHDGSHLAFVSLLANARTKIELYDVQSGKLVHSFEDHYLPMFVEDRNWLVTVAGNAVHFWDLAAGKPARPSLSLEGLRLAATSAINRDGSLLAAQLIRQKGILVWDLETGESNDEALSRMYSTALVFDSTGTQLLSITQNGTIQVWNLKTLELFQTVRFVNGYAGGIHEASLDGAAFLSFVNRDGRAQIRVWDLRGNDVRVLRGHDSYVYPVTVSPNGDVIASGSWDTTVRIWDARTGAEIVVLDEHNAMVYSLVFDSAGKRLVSASGDGKVIVWDTETYTVSHEMDLNPAKAYTAAFSSDESLLVVACGGLLVFDGRTYELKKEIRNKDLSPLDPTFVTAVEFSPSGDEFISYRGKQWMPNRELTVWDASTLEMKEQVRPPFEHVNVVSYSADGSQIAMGHASGKISLWHAGNFDRPFSEIQGHSEEVFDIAFLPDGSRLVTAGHDHTIRLWDTERHRQLAVLRGHNDYVFSLAISQNGQRIVSSSGDGTVRIWESTPLRDRLESMSTGESLRGQAESLVEELFEKLGESELVVEQLRQDDELSPALRRQAMFAVARHGRE